MFSLKDLATTLNILHVFKHLPQDENIEADAVELGIKQERIIREEELLFQIWHLINPEMTAEIEQKIVEEFLKLVYDPYLKLNSEAAKDKISLCVKFVL